MKLLHITSAYPAYLQRFYAKNPTLAKKNYAEQLERIHEDAFAWADSWTVALRSFGYQGKEILYNAEALQYAWWRENRPSSKYANLVEIAVEQAKEFAPDILWFDDHDSELILALKQALPKLRLVLGWVGSAIPEKNVAPHVDLMLSCAQESVDFFRLNGLKAEQLHHAFDPRILNRIKGNSRRSGVTFVGQILSGTKYHDERARLLRKIGQKTDFTIYSSLAEESWFQQRKKDVKTALRYFANPKKNPPPFINSIKNASLKQYLQPAIYGLEMYQALRDSALVLNIHADSSPRFSSNMRLFETTGVGACLLTDWKENLPTLFQPDEEVLVYGSADECIEKILWAMQNPKAAEAIGAAAQKRVLRDHTFAKRAELLDHYIKQRI